MRGWTCLLILVGSRLFGSVGLGRRIGVGGLESGVSDVRSRRRRTKGGERREEEEVVEKKQEEENRRHCCCRCCCCRCCGWSDGIVESGESGESCWSGGSGCYWASRSCLLFQYQQVSLARSNNVRLLGGTRIPSVYICRKFCRLDSNELFFTMFHS